MLLIKILIYSTTPPQGEGVLNIKYDLFNKAPTRDEVKSSQKLVILSETKDHSIHIK
jgi:hypothetical protein